MRFVRADPDSSRQRLVHLHPRHDRVVHIVMSLSSSSVDQIFLGSLS